jgi:hypothetical protein
MLKHFFVLISSVFLACGPTRALADSPFDVTPTRYPFLPSLVEINEPSVCSPFLAAVTEAYKGTDFDIKSVGHTLPGVGARWLLSAEDIAAQFEGTNDHQLLHDVVPLEQIRFSWDYITATEVDFAGDGSTNVLAVIGSEDNALRRYYGVLLFENKAALDGAVAGAASLDQIRERAVMSWRLDRPSVLEVDGNFYAVTNPQSSENKDVHEELWRLTSTGMQLACRIQLALTPDPRQSSARLAGTTIENLDHILDMIAGQESYCGGSLRFVDQVVIHADQVMKRAESRPWALREVDPYNDPTEIDAALYRWSQRGIWNYRMLRELSGKTDPAHDFLKVYYRDGFGLSQEAADRLADASFDLVIRSRFTFSRRPQPIDMDDPSFRLRGALLARNSEKTIAALFEAGAIVSNDYAESRWGISTEPTLFYALESPALVDLLLKRGADVNARGNFGKTALMYAAQFNLIDTATLLLERGADVNAKTSTTGDCWSAIDVADRTALMYAAENADLAMVDLLLRHGADAKATDSHKKSADAYVDRNEHVARDKTTELYRRLRDAKGVQ